MKSITALDLYNLTKCHHRVYLDANGNPHEKGEVGAFVKLLWELGLQTEREYLASLGDRTVIDLQPLSPEVAFEETLRLMKDGVSVIYQGCLMYEDCVGRPDILLKREDGSSPFGNFFYEPIDIKAGRGWEGVEGRKPRFKEHYAFQMLFYRMLLKEVQGYLPDKVRIINIDKEFEEFDPVVFEEAFGEALGQARRLVAGDDTSEPVLGSHCLLCGWFLKCQRWVREHEDPTSLFYVGKQKFRLKEVGLKTVTDIAHMNVSTYLSPPKKIPRMGERALQRMKQRAEVVLSKKPWIRPGYVFPKPSREVYFDIEDDPTQGLTYLFGMVLVEANGDRRFDYFVARHPDEEEQTVRAFWKFLQASPDDIYYVYSHKERTTLKHLMERYDLDKETFDGYVQREYDLYTKLIVEYSDWPTFSYSIKHIAKLIGFRWRDTDPSGANSIAWYNDYLSHPTQEHLLQRILDYNEDDCLAMLAIKEYFEKHARSQLV